LRRGAKQAWPRAERPYRLMLNLDISSQSAAPQTRKR
jgi:hypothetical protein